MTVRTRFAPSPTGLLHLGGVRTALYSWLYARKHGGQFILRIEDTDTERSTPEANNAIIQAMQWLNLDYDEGPFYQTERFELYNQAIDKLLAENKAYRCNCSIERLDRLREDQLANKKKPRYDGYCRNRAVSAAEPHVVRFRNPDDGQVVFKDHIRGHISIDNSELDDLIIRRTDGAPTYNLTVVIDDTDMGITHVIRGDDHINNTPRQINLLKALGYQVPEYAHVPMILGDDGARMSKRHGAVGVMHYHDKGYLPQAVLNYLIRLGWSHGDQEIFDREEMIELFDLDGTNRAPSTFNTEKLNWLNQQYIKNGDAHHLSVLLVPFLQQRGIDAEAGPHLTAVVQAQRERSSTLVELAEIALFYFQDFDSYDEKTAKKSFNLKAITALQQVAEGLAAIDNWQRESIHKVIIDTVEKLGVGFGKVAMPLRLATTGGTPSPELDLTLWLIGRDATLRRIEQAIDWIEANG